MESRLAYRIQELAYGALPANIRNMLVEAGAKHSKIRSAAGRSAQTLLMPGTTLIREWDEREYRVTVTPDGLYELNGQVFKSLSAAARHKRSPVSNPLKASTWPTLGSTTLDDWDETADKLPHGIGYLTEAAKKKGIKFGIWIEPEMVNPKSELYEKHKDWVIHLPNRDEYYFRNQLVLDLSNPKVQDYVFGVVDNLMTKYPDIAFFKWDCNSPITNIYSVYLKDKQSHLYIDYVRGLYNVLERVKAKYPDLPMMLCSGGGGRSDYEALSYFTEFWPSDNTDPIERLFIQWGFSQVFPAKTMCAHVTTWNKNSSVKFRTDVAMMCKLGFDIKLADMSKDDETYCRTAVQNYNRLKPVVLEGDMYRLVSPYGSNHTSTMYVGKDKDKAVVFAFDIHPRYAEKTLPVRLQGLDADKMYRVKEINLMPGANSSLSGNGEVFSGEFLMNVGLNLFTTQQLNSRVVEVVAE